MTDKWVDLHPDQVCLCIHTSGPPLKPKPHGRFCFLLLFAESAYQGLVAEPGNGLAEIRF